MLLQLNPVLCNDEFIETECELRPINAVRS